jgi:hypothetical protein
MKSNHWIVALSVSFLFPFTTYALEGESSTVAPSNNRQLRKLGFYLAVQDPAPTVLGTNVAYNLTDYARLSLGFGETKETTGMSFSSQGDSTVVTTQEAKASTIGAGARFMMPSRNLTPTLGLHVARIEYSGTGGIEVGGFKESTTHVYSSIGFDWQAKSGFQASAGYNLSLSPSGHNSVYASAGYFVNWLN